MFTSCARFAVSRLLALSSRPVAESAWKKATPVACLSSASQAGWVAGQPPPRAAALVIGSEVLSGKIMDSNSVLLARLLYSRGVDLVRMVTIADDSEEITRQVRELSALVGPSGFVFTSGGIGPTHDDVTYEAVAAAFGAKLSVHEGTVELMRAHYKALGKEVNAARLRMATLPEGCRVHTTPNVWVPLAQISNVFVLPGVPWLFKSMIEANKELFQGPQMRSVSVYTRSGEGDLAQALTAIAAAHPSVSIGSYPNTNRALTDYSTKLCCDGRDEEAVEAAMAAIRAAIPCFDQLPPTIAAAGK